MPTSLLRIGKIKAAVLPVPVCAQAIISLFSNIFGIANSWIGVAFSKPMWDIASRSEASNFKSVNFILTVKLAIKTDLTIKMTALRR